MSKLPIRYASVDFKKVFIPSFAMLLAALAILFFSNYSLPLLGSVGLWSIPLGVIAAAITYVLVFWLTSCQWLDNSDMRKAYKLLIDVFENLTWPQIVLLSMSAGIGEELLFRGLLQTWLISVGNPFWGIAVASLIFGFLHYLNTTYVLLTFLLGGLFGIVYYVTDSLLLVVVAHTVYDIIAFGVIVKYPSLLKADR